MQTVTLKLIPDTAKANLTFSSNYRLYSTKDPLPGAHAITGFTDDVDLNGNNSAYLSKKFRYSVDRGNWSLWYDVADIGALAFNNSDLFVELKYEYNDTTRDQLPQPITVNEIKFKITAENSVPSLFTPSIVCSDEVCPALISTGTMSFNPYAADQAVNIFKQLSFNTNKLFGHEVVYFKTEPDRDSADYVFKEWTLFKTISRKCIKVLVPGNKFPDNKPTYAEFGVDFEMPFEIHVDHQYFQTVFGATSHPRKKDFLYFPLTNRMYEIQGTYLYRGIMQEPVYWKIQLVKFQPNIDMLMKAADRTFLDNIITSTDELFADQMIDEVKDATMPQQFKTISSKFDETRKALHPDLKIKQLALTYNYSPLIQYYYESKSVPSLPITVIPETSNFTKSSVKFEDPATKYTLIAYEESDLFSLWAGYKLTTYDLSAGAPIKIRGPYNSNDPQLGRYIKIDRYADSNFFTPGQLAFEVDTNGHVHILTRDYGVVYNEVGQFGETQSNLTFFALVRINANTDSISFIDAFDNLQAKGLKLDGSIGTINNSTDKNVTIRLEINSTLTQFSPVRFEIDKWYAIFVPVSSQFKQTALTIYSFNQDPANANNFNDTTQLHNSAKTLSGSDSFEFDIAENFRLVSSPIDIANIRVFNTMIQEEDHDFVISQLFIKDESILRIIDNCRPRLNIPYIGINR
jgi:hypothetical protein